jgi:hypothetical protein
MEIKQLDLSKILLEDNETLFIKLKGNLSPYSLKQFHKHMENHFGPGRVIIVDITDGEMEITKIAKNENT